MQLDWFTFVAQIVNFVILLALLQRFLYRPILGAMRMREEQIAARFQEAESLRQEAHQEAAIFHQKHAELAQQRASLLADAVADAQQRRKQLLSEARQEVEDVRERWFAALSREKSLHLQSVRQQLVAQLFAIAQRALRDLANADLEEQIVAQFCQRLQQLDTQEKRALSQAMQSSTQRVVVRTAFKLKQEGRIALECLLRELFDGDVQPLFEQAPDLLCGIELQVYGHRISWSLHDYVETLEQQLVELFDANCMKNAAQIVAA